MFLVYYYKFIQDLLLFFLSFSLNMAPQRQEPKKIAARARSISGVRAPRGRPRTRSNSAKPAQEPVDDIEDFVFVKFDGKKDFQAIAVSDILEESTKIKVYLCIFVIYLLLKKNIFGLKKGARVDIKIVNDKTPGKIELIKAVVHNEKFFKLRKSEVYFLMVIDFL